MSESSVERINSPVLTNVLQPVGGSGEVTAVLVSSFWRSASEMAEADKG